ncbi:MAG TPA: hypothetical protein VNJ06_00100 [Gemmatimonadales bacterium]|nr:hypothetical protein [Gemmatimonadales bacterium]
MKEGHEVKLFIEAKDEREIADGFVAKTDEWVPRAVIQLIGVAGGDCRI